MLDTLDPSQDTLELARQMALAATSAFQQTPVEGTDPDAISAMLLASGALLVAFCRHTGADYVEVLRDALRHLGRSYEAGLTVH